jgi:hypothetical protein
MTVDGSCPIYCEVVGSQIEFRFGNDESGLHLFLDGEALGKWLGLTVMMVERVKALPRGERADFVVGNGKGT